MMRIIGSIWLGCLVVVSVVIPAEAQECVFCEVPRVENRPVYPLGGTVLPFGGPPVVVPQVPSNDAASRYLDAQTNATNEALSIYKYQAGILSNPQAQQQINIDRMMQDLRVQLNGGR
jgi:hypothetical protein